MVLLANNRSHRRPRRLRRHSRTLISMPGLAKSAAGGDSCPLRSFAHPIRCPFDRRRAEIPSPVDVLQRFDRRCQQSLGTHPFSTPQADLKFISATCMQIIASGPHGSLGAASGCHRRPPPRLSRFHSKMPSRLRSYSGGPGFISPRFPARSRACRVKPAHGCRCPSVLPQSRR